MAKTVLITMSLVGLDVGPTLDLYSDVDGYTTPFETGVPRYALEGGYTSSLVPDAAIRIRVYSVGVCTNYAQCSIAVAHSLAYSATSCEEACSTTPVIYYSQCSELVLYYCYLWTDPSLTSLFEAPAGFYSDGVNCYDYRFPHSGFIAITPCSAPVSFNCVSGICIDPGDGSGTYATLGACEAVCSLTPVTSYNCESGTCIEVSGSGGTYITLSACEAVCALPAVNYLVRLYDIDCNILGSGLVISNSGSLNIGYFYATNELPGEIVEMLSFTSTYPDYFTNITSPGYTTCPDVP